MTETTALVPTEVGFLDLRPAPGQPDQLRMAIASFLSKYTGKTLAGYRCDLNIFLGWCADPEHTVAPLHAQRGHIELYLRWMEQTGWASATIAKRYDTVRGFYKAADRDDYLPGKDPCRWVERPKIDHDGQRRTFLTPLEFGQFIAAAKTMGPRHYAFACLLGLNALRCAEACSLNIEDMTVDGGYDVINFIGKGGGSYAVPLSMPVMRAVAAAIDGRTEGPILTTKWKTRMTKSSARRLVKAIAVEAGVNTDISPHSLRRSFATTAVATGVPIRDVQVTLRHRSINTTTIYDRGGTSHDRNSTHRVASFVSGIAT